MGKMEWDSASDNGLRKMEQSSCSPPRTGRVMSLKLRLLLGFSIIYTVFQVGFLPVIGLTLVYHSPSIVPISYSGNLLIALYFMINIIGNWYLVWKFSSFIPCTPNSSSSSKLACSTGEGDTFHCWICKRNIWRRDHHCIFLASCIARVNWGNFMAFCFQATLGTSYSFFLMLQYCRLHFAEVFSSQFYFYIFPVTLWKWFSGETLVLNVVLVALLNMTVATVLGTSNLFCYHLHGALKDRSLPFSVTGFGPLQRAFGLAWPWSLFFPSRANFMTIVRDDLDNVKSV